jgi:hypothetical protein
MFDTMPFVDTQKWPVKSILAPLVGFGDLMIHT